VTGDGVPPRRVALGEGAEFDLIRRVLASSGELPPDVLLGPGDDAAVLEGGWVLSADLSVEDVHFRRAWLSDAEIGYRAGAAALSDLAAMAARPVGVLVSLTLPPAGGADAEAVHAGIREAASAVGAVVLGGDVSRSPGPLVVDVVVVGRTDAPALRSGAVPGDELWVTGVLGGAAAAVGRWTTGTTPEPELRDAFARPVPRVAEALRLAALGVVHALVDLSDGLAGDAGHLSAAGGVRVVLEAARIPVAPGARAALGDDEALQAALHGGEDYELCFAAAAGAVHGRELDVPLTRVGRVEAGEGVWLDAGDGEPRRLARGGFSHVPEAGS
jgi:thiamine-monophosphate kinase